jgi:hypothetical protein
VLLIRAFFVIAAISVWLYCVYDVIRSDGSAVQHLHKLVWLVFVLFIPTVGALAWLFLGRPQPLGSRLFEPPQAPARAPDDSPEFLASLEDEIRRRRRAERRRAEDEPAPYDKSEIDDEIRRLEDELRRRSEEEGGEGPPGA